jgi:hypothetical protein
MAETRDTAAGELRVAGDINIEFVRINSIANNTYFDIKNQMMGLYIYEDMFSPFITGSIIVKDSLDLINALPFSGMEVLDLRAYTPTLDQLHDELGIIQGKFYIYKITEREYSAEKQVVYQLHFISVEAMSDLNTKLSRPYEGKVSDIVKKLVKEAPGFDSWKALVLEETKNKTKFVSNYWSPVRCINFCLDQAQTTNNSNTYLFFENRAGFNFVSLDFLNDQPSRQKFNYGTSTDDKGNDGGSNRNIDKDFSKILEMSVPVGFDYIDRIRAGTYTSRMITHDLTTKRYKTVNYDYLDKFTEGRETRLNKFPLTTEQVIARVNATIFRAETNNQVFNGFGDVSAIRSIQDRVSRMKQAEAFKVTIKVKGRSDYTVGQKVYLNIPKPTPTGEQDTPDETVDTMFSGNYLIAAINHNVDRETHECWMELIKDSLMFDLATGKTS